MDAFERQRAAAWIAIVCAPLALAACGCAPTPRSPTPTAAVTQKPAPSSTAIPDVAPPASLPSCDDITGAMVTAALGVAVSDPTTTRVSATAERCAYPASAAGGSGVSIFYDAYPGSESLWLPEFTSTVGHLAGVTRLSGLGVAAYTQANSSTTDGNEDAVYAVDATGLEVSVTSDASLTRAESLITAILSE
jgi:hypothetical protein